MQAGRLRQRVAIDRPSVSEPTDAGGVAIAWEERERRWACVEPLAGRELEYAQQQAAEVTHRVTLRFDRFTRSLPTTFRLRWINSDCEHELAIVAVLPDQRNRFVTVLCAESQ